MKLTGERIVIVPEADRDGDGITAFQMVSYSLDFYGTTITGRLDSKIMEDGQQIIMTGDGWIPGNMDITGLVE